MKRLFHLTVILALCVSCIAFGGNDEDKGKQANQKKFEEALKLVRNAFFSGDKAERLLRECDDFVGNVVFYLNFEDKEGFPFGYVTKGLYEKRECKVIFADENIASFLMEKTSYSGGAHPNSTFAVGTFVRGRKDFPLRLEDIMTPEQIPQMTALIRLALREKFGLQTDEELTEATKEFAEPKPTQNFYYDDKGLHFVYNEYEIACYAEGRIDICIQWPRPLCALERPDAEANRKTDSKVK